MPTSIEAGLCGHCRWAQRIQSARGSEFIRCRRSDDDSAFPRYPRLPMHSCPGFQTNRPVDAPPLPRRAPGARAEVLVTNLNEPLFERLGGREGVERIVDRFYDLVEADPELRPLFPEDMRAGREKQKWFFEQWFGGDFLYSQRFGHPRLRRRHFPFIIDQKAAGRWLRHFNQALQDSGVARTDIEEIMGSLGPLAHHMVNASEDVPRDPLGDVRMS